MLKPPVNVFRMYTDKNLLILKFNIMTASVSNDLLSVTHLPNTPNTNFNLPEHQPKNIDLCTVPPSLIELRYTVLS